ncbi:hypothetical protein PS3A_41890 [Pseudomonas sp. 3A(2025)]
MQGNNSDTLTYSASKALNDYRQFAALEQSDGAHEADRPSQLSLFPHREGYKTLVSRLFFNSEPPVRDGVTGMNSLNISRPEVEFLTQQDRTLLSRMYNYAQEQGADLQYVDDVARDIGDYRQHNDGRALVNMNTGNSYDIQGRQLSVKFTEPYAATVEHILNGTAINSTLLDKGFLRFSLDPGHHPYTTHSDLKFMAQMVNHFSVQPSEGNVLSRDFATYSRNHKIKDKIVQASDTIRLELREEPEASKVTAKPKAPINPFEGLIGKKAGKSRLLTLFDYLFMKMKTQGRVRRP